MTLSDDFAAQIVKVEATFGFAEFACDPDEISEVLGVVPDEVRRKGEIRTGCGGHVITVPFSTWGISSQMKSKDVNAHLRQLLNRLDGKAARRRAEWGTPGFEIHYVATHLRSGNGPFFELDVVQGIASWGAELWQDIYSVEDEA